MLIVQKYGGTSVGSIECIRRVAARVVRTCEAGHGVVVVVSAMAGETDRLLKLARAVGPMDPRELDVLLASGEQVSIALVALAIKAAGGRAVSMLGHQVGMLTDSSHSQARIHAVSVPTLRAALDAEMVPVVAGFQGVDPGGNITTLGRGGSDTSAVAVAASLRAGLCEIYTDVKGVYTADPNICPAARKIERVTYEEMLELASLGAKVLQIRSVEVAHNHRVPLHVRSSFCDEEGTMVVAEDDRLHLADPRAGNEADSGEMLEQVVVTGVSLDANQARLTIWGLPWHCGIHSELFKPLADAGIVVDMIVQNPPTAGRSNISFTMAAGELERALDLVSPSASKLGAERLLSDGQVSKVSIVGVAMRSHAGVALRMFEILAQAGIDILMIGTSEIKVSCIISREQGEAAVRALHRGFGLGG